MLTNKRMRYAVCLSPDRFGSRDLHIATIIREELRRSIS